MFRLSAFPAPSAALAGVFLVAVSGVAWTATLRVPSEYPTIQEGVDAAAAGDSVVVAAGTYTGTGNRNIAFRGLDIVVVSESGPEFTTIDVQGSSASPGRGFVFERTETAAAVLDGFTIEGGWMSAEESFARSPRHELSGGGVTVRNRSRPTLRNLIVRTCHSQYTGGGISVELFGEPVIENVLITECTAGIQGGGLSIETQSTPLVRNCVITGNRAPNGGGVAYQAAGQLVNCTIAGNYADFGGGLSVFTFTDGFFERVILWGNCAEMNGDELFVDAQGFATFSCSVVDSSGVHLIGVVDWGGDLVADDPQFCDPLWCTRAPVEGGDYTLADSSPALAARSPCGVLIGALGVGTCGFPPAVVESSWGKIKARFQGAAPAR